MYLVLFTKRFRDEQPLESCGTPRLAQTSMSEIRLQGSVEESEGGALLAWTISISDSTAKVLSSNKRRMNACPFSVH